MHPTSCIVQCASRNMAVPRAIFGALVERLTRDQNGRGSMTAG
jgi:hypothetical protein